MRQIVQNIFCCILECTEHKWKKYENKQSSGAFQYKDAENVQQCLDFCIVNLDCVGVDVNTGHDPPTCWPHFDTAQFSDDKVFDRVGVDQYRLVKRCGHQGISSSDTGTWSRPHFIHSPKSLLVIH